MDEQAYADTVKSTPSPAALPPATLTAIEVVLDFKTLDQNQDGEISAVEFIDGLRSQPHLASRFGLSDDILNDNGTRTKYELTFRIIDYNHSETVNVIPLPSRNELLCFPLCLDASRIIEEFDFCYRHLSKLSESWFRSGKF